MSGTGQPRSVQNTVNLRGKPCALKRHFRGYLRQLIGFLDLMAARDPERFVWAGWETLQKHSRKWPRKSGSQAAKVSKPDSKPKKVKRAPRTSACRSEIYVCLSLAEQHGIIEDVKRFRNGAMRRGYIVKAHDDVAMSGEQICTMFTPKLRVNGHQNGHQNGHYFGHQNGHQNGLFDDGNRTDDWTKDWTKDWTPKSLQSCDTAREMSKDDVVLYVDSDVVLQGAIPVNPVIPENPGSPVSSSRARKRHAHTLDPHPNSSTGGKDTESPERPIENTSTLGTTESPERMGQEYHCFIETPRGKIRFTIAEARLLLAEGWVRPPDENGRCAVVGALDLDGIVDQATWAAEYDWQNEQFENFANWFAHLDDQDGPVCLPHRDRLDPNPGMLPPDPPALRHLS